MNMGELLILAALVIPLFLAAASLLLSRAPDVRDTINVMGAIALSIVGGAILLRTGEGMPPIWQLAKPLPGLAIAFHLERLGAVFAVMSSVLWALTTLFAIGYMRGKHEANQSRFFACFALSMFAVMGIAMAANLFTLFIFYEVLTLATYPLVAHRGDEAARRAGRIYIGTLLGASVLFLLPGVIYVHAIARSTDFVPGGLLAGLVDGKTASIVLLLCVFGAAKAAMPPLHLWLPRAMVAPAPVSAFLHAVAVVKAGVFVILKVAIYILGPGLVAAAPAAQWLVWLAAATLIGAGVMALRAEDLKARLAWSTVGHLAAITGGALLAVTGGALTAGLHMVMHAIGKVTLFMCAGAIEVATGATRVADMRGLGKRMPLVFIAFLAASCSVIGLPPLGGMWSKFLLLTVSFGSGEWVLAAALMISSLLAAIYFLPFAFAALMPPSDAPPPIPLKRTGGAPRLAVAPVLAAAVLTAAMFVLADPLLEYLSPIVSPAESAP